VGRSGFFNLSALAGSVQGGFFLRKKPLGSNGFGVGQLKNRWSVLRRFFEGRSEMGTFVPSGKDVVRKFFVIDASGKTLGRLATKAADVLSGKLNPQYVPYIDTGDHVIVINAEKVRLTGLKASQKLYRRYTGFPGGLREESFTRLLNRKPEMILEQAIKGMLPKSKMGRQMATKLKVYRGDKHPHQAQMPVELEIS
jgi:large subunit ribosomal protein L13